MKINATRLQSYFEAMSEIGKIGETGTCRPAHTTLEKQGFENAASWMKEAKITNPIAGICSHTTDIADLKSVTAKKVTKKNP